MLRSSTKLALTRTVALLPFRECRAQLYTFFVQFHLWCTSHVRARSSAVLGIICALHHFSFLGQSELARCSTIRACALLDCVPERVWRRLHALYPVHPRAVEEKRCHTSCSLFSTVSAEFSLGNRIYGYFIMIFLQLLSGPFQWLGSISRQPPFLSSRHHSPHFIKVFTWYCQSLRSSLLSGGVWDSV